MHSLGVALMKNTLAFSGAGEKEDAGQQDTVKHYTVYSLQCENTG